MRQQVVALAGLSGVGKSTLLGAVSSTVTMQVLQASGLVRMARELADGAAIASDALRTRNLDENQQLLVRGFARQRDPAAQLVVLDCHTVIETSHGLVRIDPGVFGAVGITGMIVLVDKPEEIAERRRKDASRQRPATALEDLGAVQDAAVDQARTICTQLGVSLYIYHLDEADALKDRLASYAFDPNAKGG